MSERAADAPVVGIVMGSQSDWPTMKAAAEVLDALEGPVALTACSQAEGLCELEAICLVGDAWQRVNVAIRRSLEEISLAQLTAGPGTPIRPPDFAAALGASEPARS